MTNTSTGFSGFQLMTGHSLCTIPALTTLHHSANLGEVDTLNQVKGILQTLKDNVWAAKDNLLLSKITQASQKNKHQSMEIRYDIRDKVMLSTFHCHQGYIQKGQNHIAKFMPQFDGLYTIIDAFPLCSVYTIDMLNCP